MSSAPDRTAGLLPAADARLMGPELFESIAEVARAGLDDGLALELLFAQDATGDDAPAGRLVALASLLQALAKAAAREASSVVETASGDLSDDGAAEIARRSGQYLGNISDCMRAVAALVAQIHDDHRAARERDAAAG